MPFFTAVGEQPEQFSGGGLFHAIVGKVGTDVSALSLTGCIFAVAGCAVFDRVSHATSPNRDAGPVAGALRRARDPDDAAAARHSVRDGNGQQSSLDASQILPKAQKIDASVDRSRVYRTLRLLKRQGPLTNST
jgi:hypothetical protein